MEQLANDVALLLLVGTPFLVLAKLVHGLAAQRPSFAPRRTRGAKVELVAWLLLGTVDAHTFALWSNATLQAQDVCTRYRPELGSDVYLSGGYFFDYPVSVRCVWPGGQSVEVTAWPLNVLTALFAAAAVAVVAHAVFRRRSQQEKPIRGEQR
ncbi:hypothetical protein [Actinophytocola oryzae]|uniref:Uncharacterized protein n=1 Tax=Actinophytocola oryzae TaxID=502181 RepID=A0A4R7UQ24_9PSEU|nr:hypothetical protein [Actinophytocola oryzae]TDV36084.1 hypothetical protein CLV71_13262 [Actinophytocola oryzae]